MLSKSSSFLITFLALAYLTGCGGGGGGQESNNTLIGNYAPVAQDQNLSTPEDHSLRLTLHGSDSDGDSLSYRLLSSPAHGTLGGTAPNLTYTPAPDYNGEDSFAFVVNDGKADSQPATVRINVTPVNDAPIARDDNATTDEETPVTVNVLNNDSDPDGSIDPASLRILHAPTHGTAQVLQGKIHYTPATNYTGADSLSYRVNDNEGLSSNPTTLTLSVRPVNDAPVAVDDHASLKKNRSLEIHVLSNDIIRKGAIDPDSITVTLSPQHGSIQIHDGIIVYTPQRDFSGSDMFKYIIADQSGHRSNEATVTVVIRDENLPPQAYQMRLETPEETPLSLTLSGSDPDGDPLNYRLLTPPAHGTLSGIAPDLIYTPVPDYNGEDSMSFIVNDGRVDSQPATVTINVTPLNDAPIAQDQNLSTPEDHSLRLTLHGSDSDGDSLSYRLLSSPIHGTLEGTAPNLTYTPAPDYNGEDRFAFVVNDGKTDSQPATVRINVTPVNDAPIARDDNASSLEGRPIRIEPLKNDLDPDGNDSKLHIVAITQPEHGRASMDEKTVYYTPYSALAAQDLLTYTIEDEQGTRSSARIIIQILHKNLAPVAYNKTITTEEDHPVSFDLNASDPDGDPLGYTLLNPALLPEHGTLGGTPPHLVYTPDPNYNGSDYIAFDVNDGKLHSAPAVITFVIRPLNDPPVADAGADARGLRGDTFTLDGSASYDVDGTITHYLWQEGNRTIGTEKTLRRQFTVIGQHRIRLTVTDDQNATGSDEKIITIESCSQGCIYPDPTATNPYQ